MRVRNEFDMNSRLLVPRVWLLVVNHMKTAIWDFSEKSFFLVGALVLITILPAVLLFESVPEVVMSNVNRLTFESSSLSVALLQPCQLGLIVFGLIVYGLRSFHSWFAGL